MKGVRGCCGCAAPCAHLAGAGTHGRALALHRFGSLSTDSESGLGGGLWPLEAAEKMLWRQEQSWDAMCGQTR